MGYDVEKFRFEVGDIVSESELISWSSDGPLMGLIVNIKRNHYHGYFSEFEKYPAIDKVTVLWFRESFMESLPSDLVILVARDPFYQNNKS
tara:strand:+ start:273 stop:545 length:273 start_codon:yes stop_codon:yes gene_type:complete